MRLFLAAVLSFGLLAQAGFAQTTETYYAIQSGTGFFINRMYIITNAHVVKGCQRVKIKGAVPEREVSVKVIDTEHDLAMLETNEGPLEFAPLRFNIDDLKVGDKVFVIGYPGVEGALGKYKMMDAEVVHLEGYIPDSHGQFYISDVVRHGNSGGPVFDGSGNVIGVVVATGTLTMTDQQSGKRMSEQHTGVVISLNTLKTFLEEHGAYTELNGSGLLYNNDYIEGHAKDYIVNVQCWTKLDHAPKQGNEESN